MGQGEELTVTYIDYSAAFDSISHKWLDLSLKAAGSSRKTRAIFRAIYAAAEGTARVRGLDGNHVYSDSFAVRRGVIQGDIISPIFFILALEQLFRLYDKDPEGIKIGNYLQIGVLGYADDAAMLSRATNKLSTRVNKISEKSREKADMLLNKGKTKNMHVRHQEKLAPPSIDVIKKTEDSYKHVCKFCDRRFKTSRGLHIHMASCDNQHGLTPEAFPIEGTV